MRLEYYANLARMGDRYRRNPAWGMSYGWLCLYEFYEYLDTSCPIGQEHGDTHLKMQVALFQ